MTNKQVTDGLTDLLHKYDLAWIERQVIAWAIAKLIKDKAS